MCIRDSPRTDRHPTATTERDRQEAAGLPKEDRLPGDVDLHRDSGYGRLSGDADDDVTGYGARGANLLRRGNTPS
eukprot:7102745-Pyramimonas_sp.AAC.1